METVKRKLTVLVADDESALREHYVSCLEDFDVEIVEACNGLDALSKFEGRKIDCVITDVMMPKMNGFEFLSELRQRNFFKPVIISTAYADKDKCIKALQLGAFDLIEKPFKLADFISTMEEALKVSRAMNHFEDELLEGLAKSGYPIPQDLQKTVSSILKMKALRHKSAS